MKRFLVVASSALLFAGPAVAAAKVGRPFRALEGESFGVSYFLTAFAGPGIFRGSERDCHYLVLEAGPWGATGCASARRGLADYGEVCAEPGRFLYGLAPATAAVVRGVTTGGRPFAGRVQPLPARWQSKASAWILAVAPMVSLRSIEALDSHRHVLVRFALAPSQLRCPRVAAHASGRLPGGVRWKFAVRGTRGAGRIQNVCVARTVSKPVAPFTVTDQFTECEPVSFVRNALFLAPASQGEHSCSPSYGIFSGLVSRQVSSVTVVLEHGGRLRARGLRATGIPFNAFVVATRRNDNEIAYLLRTRDGRTHRVSIGRGLPQCRAR